MVVVACIRRGEQLLARGAGPPLEVDAKHRLGDDGGLLTPLPLLLLLQPLLLLLPLPAMPPLIAAMSTVSNTMALIPPPVWPSRLAIRPAMTTPARGERGAAALRGRKNGDFI